MIYFSELKEKKVVTEDQAKVGYLEDVIFQVSETPLVTKIVVRGLLKEKLIIPATFIKKIDSSIILAKGYAISLLEENELFLVKNLLDKQIIDLQGNKIVRVNDVAIQDKNELYIAGVDVGILGILRWLKLEDLFSHFLIPFHIKPSSNFLSWGDVQPLELVHGEVKLRRKEDKLQRICPEDLADYLGKTNVDNARKFLKILDDKKVAEVIGHMNLNYRAALFRHFKPEKSARLLAHVVPDEAVDILLTLPTKKRNDIINLLSEEKKKEFNHLIQYSTTQIGSLLTTEYLTVESRDSVREIIKKIQKETSEFSFLSSIFVVNEKKELIGLFNLHELLLLKDLDLPAYKFMVQNIVVAHITTPVEIALDRLLKYRFSAIPVIDNNKNMIGIVTILDLLRTVVKR